MPPILRPRISAIATKPESPGGRFRKDFWFAVIIEYPPLHGGLFDRHVVEEVVASDGEDAVGAADGGASGMPFLTDNQQARFTVRIPHVRIAHQLIGDGTPKVEADDLRDIRYSQLVNIWLWTRRRSALFLPDIYDV